MNKASRTALVVLLGSLYAATVHAQDATGKIAGIITDPAGALILGAPITVTNAGTNSVKRTVTDTQGFYQVQQLPVGQYRVTAESPGFSKTESAAASLDINQTLRVDLTLQLGKVSDVVNVDSRGSTVETENSTVGGTVIGKAIFELPLNGRNILDLLQTQPGVTATNSDSSAAGNYSIAGGRTDSVTYLLDGGLNNDLLSNSVVVNPNPDAVAEFKVIESSYSAEYGRNAGGIVSIVTKSGTNELHGTLFDYARNTVFDANDFFSNEQGQARAVLNRQQFGGTLGGPIVIPHVIHGRNKLFFFFSYQGQKQSTLALQGQIPTFTPAEAQGDFSQADAQTQQSVANFLTKNPYYQSNPQLASQGIIDPTKIDPVAQAYFKNNLIPTSPTGFLFPEASAVDNENEYLGRFDYNITDKDTLTGTFTAHDAKVTSPFAAADVTGYTSGNFTQTYSGSLAYTHIFTASLFNEVRVSAVRSAPTNYVPTSKLPGPQQLGIDITPDITSGPPDLFFYGSGLATGFAPYGPTTIANNIYSYYDNVAWTKGVHNLKFGFYFSPYQNNTAYDFYGNGSYAFYGPSTYTGSGVDVADFLLGLPDSYFQGSYAENNIRSHQYAGYGQDEWHVSKRLTLNLGLRYEYSQPKYDTQGKSFSFVPGAQSERFPNAPEDLLYPGDPGAPKGTNFPDKTNFAPRFGFAWDVFGNAKTAIRGGVGVFYDVLKGEDNLQFNGSPPFYAEPNLYFNGLDGTETGPTGYLSNPFGTNNTGTTNGFPSRPPNSNVSYASFLPLSSGGAVYLVDPHLKTPYEYQYSLNVQQQLPAGMMLEVGYVGYSAHGLTSLVDINPFPLGSDTRIYDPDSSNSIFGNLDQFKNVSNANYNSMTVNLTKRTGETRFGDAFYTLAYTWGHELDNASGFQERNSEVPYYNWREFYASGDTDVRNNLVLSGGWDLPFDRMWQRGPKLLTRGWSLYPIVTWRTGFPIDVTAGLQTSNTDPGPAGDGAAGLVRADLVAQSVGIYNPRTNQLFNGNTGNYYFNPTALSNSRLLNLDSLAQSNPAALIGQFTEGTLGRNALRGPGVVNADITLAKHFILREKFTAELRLDAFNVLNHTNFDNPNTNINSSQFGQITTENSVLPRILQIALHLQF